MAENTIDTDIVETLRWVANSAQPVDAAQMRLAADEIERLRAELDRALHNTGRDGT